MARKPARAKSRNFLADASKANAPVPVNDHGVPGWTLFAKPLMANEMRDVTERSLKDGKSLETAGEDALDNERFALAIMGASIVDERGRRVIAIEDEPALREKLPSRAFMVLQRDALAVNGMGGEDSGSGN